MTGSRMNEAYDKAKKCLDQLLSNDQIPFYGYVEIMLQLDVMKREGSKEADDWQKYSDELWNNAYERGKQDARPQGEWLTRRVAFHLTCSFCGCHLRALKDEVFEGDYEYNFCPNCGADMRGEKSNE